ncbi:MAG: S8 family peptidase, partial [Oscillospiraceae bacterium]
IIIVETSIECLGTITVPQKPVKAKDEDEEHFQSRIKRWEIKMGTAYEEWDKLCRTRQAEIDRFIYEYDGEVLEIYDYVDDLSPLDTFELKLKIPAKCLRDFAENYPYVFEITFPEDFSIDNLRGQLDTTLYLDFELHGPDDTAPTVCVIDSGIQEGHVYINPAIKPELSKCYLADRTSVEDEVDEGGHGTRVAGAVLYPQGLSTIGGDYILPCYIANAKVLNENNVLPETLLPSKLISKVVKDYYDENGIRLFNHSIAGSSPCRTKYMSSWAAAIDNISFEKDVLFMQASGNIWDNYDTPIIRGIKQHLDSGKDYPIYLNELSCRIANPSQSMQALTIGSICCGEYEDDDLKSFGTAGAVSSFSRSGFGLWKSIKPEVVEAGGDWIRSKHNNNTFLSKDEICPELIRRSPEGPAYAKDTGGTSFATPKISYIAAQLQKTLPHESSLLYKTLIVHSTRWTDWATNLPEHEYINVLQYMGYGLPDAERATSNDEYRITFITNGERHIIGGDIHIYRIKVPKEIRSLNAEIRVDVTLSFSAKPRRTRKGFKGYFSTWVDWTSSKFNEDVQDFASRMLVLDEVNDSEMESAALSRGIAWTIGAQDNHGKIKDISRSRSATQKDWAVMPAYTLPEEFCIAVVGHKGWCKNGEHYAKYALAVGFEALNKDMDIYVPFSVQIETAVETETEIETEIEVRDTE